MPHKRDFDQKHAYLLYPCFVHWQTPHFARQETHPW